MKSDEQAQRFSNFGYQPTGNSLNDRSDSKKRYNFISCINIIKIKCYDFKVKYSLNVQISNSVHLQCFIKLCVKSGFRVKIRMFQSRYRLCR